MNIYVYNCSNTFNYGSMMMGENFLSYFEKVTTGKNEYFVETDKEINITRLKQASGIENITAVKLDSLFQNNVTRSDYIKGYFGLKKITSELAKKIDLIIVLGGDDFTEDYGWKPPVINALKLNVLKREGLKIVMLGQTMGPYKAFREPIMRRLLGKLDKIYARDPFTMKYLAELKLKNTDIMDDLALLPLSKQKERVRSKEYITYCPSELIYRYSRDGKREDWIDFNIFMVNEILERYPDKKIVLLAHVLEPAHVDDRKIASELNSMVEERYKDRVILRDEEMYPYEVRDYIQQSLFTISSRMHPIVSSIQSEIPAIALSYSTKYWGIIGERYGLSDYILDVRYLSYEEMREKLKVLLMKIDQEYKEIQIAMRKNNEMASGNILNKLNEISRMTL